MKNKILKYSTCLTVLFVFVLCPFALCEKVELDACITALENRYGSMKDISSSFKQETFLSIASRIEKAEGKVYIKKGGKMFWDYIQPTPQKIILEGENLWIYLPDEKQVVESSITSFSSHIVADLIYGKVNIMKRFNVSFLSTDSEDNSSNIILELLPKEYNPTIKRLLLEIDPAGSLITETVLEDELGTKTTLMFSEIKVDKGIEDSCFTFTPPPGVEIFSPPKF